MHQCMSGVARAWPGGHAPLIALPAAPCAAPGMRARLATMSDTERREAAGAALLGLLATLGIEDSEGDSNSGMSSRSESDSEEGQSGS